MTRSLITAALFALPLAVQSMPTSKNTFQLTKRLTDGVDCVGSSVDVPENFIHCFNSDGIDLSCDECNGASTDQGVQCWAASADNSMNMRVACPQDPGPQVLPDGSTVDPSLGATIANTFCANQGGGGLFGPFATVGCLAWTAAASGYSDYASAQAGVSILCNTFLSGLCAAIDSGALSIPDTPCVDDPDGPNPDLCSFAGPGK